MKTENGLLVEEVVWSCFLKMCHKIGAQRNVRDIMAKYTRENHDMNGFNLNNASTFNEFIDGLTKMKMPTNLHSFGDGNFIVPKISKLEERTMFLVNTLIYEFLDRQGVITHEEAPNLGKKLFTLCMCIFEGKTADEVSVCDDCNENIPLQIPQPRNRKEAEIMKNYLDCIRNGNNISLHDYVVSLVIQGSHLVNDFDVVDFVQYINQ